MKTKYPPLIPTVLSLMLSTLSVQICRADGGYHLQKEISVNWEGGCESLAMDEMAHRLYIVHGPMIEVVDPDKGKVIAEMTNATSISGCVLSPQFRRGFFGNGQDPKIGIFDMNRQLMVKPFTAQGGIDAIVYALHQGLLYTFNQNDQSVSIFESDDGDFVKTIKLPGKPGVAVVDQKTGRVYCCLQGKSVIVAIDPRTHKISSQWDVLPEGGASAIAIDPVRQRLFVAGHDKTVMMMNSINGAVLSTTAVNGDIRGMVFDPFGKYLLINDGNSLDVALEYTVGHLNLTQNIPLQQSGNAMVLDSTTHKIYLVGGQSSNETSASANHSISVYGL